MLNTAFLPWPDYTIEEVDAVKIGNLSWIGIGACIRQQVTIGEQVVVGAGTVVIKNISDKRTVVGVPGRIVEKEEP